ncbi:VOC family protein [Streptomyces sioyaensis]|uniref:VOC family protein n=1 Tax=Streptomyces sioyaensis TaxID=67364 RepID=UPI003D71B3BA
MQHIPIDPERDPLIHGGPAAEPVSEPAPGERPDFGLTGVERVTFAVEDLPEATRFLDDWGLSRGASEDSGSVLFRAADGSEVELVEADPSDPARRPVGDAGGLVRITWGVRNPSSLPAIEKELGRDRDAVIDSADVLHSFDDLGFRLAFRPTLRRTVEYDVTTYNAPGHPARIDARAVSYDRARPTEISHLAIAVDDAGKASRFYLDRLGFRVSDRYANRGMFLRCTTAGNHHNLFLLNGAEPGPRFNHLAFKVRDVHEVILGGQAFDAKGWQTFAGPGRHQVSSACFWYFRTPFGGSFEYAADEDMVTEEWEAMDFAAEAHVFSQWTFGLDKGDGTLRGPISQSRAQ